MGQTTVDKVIKGYVMLRDKKNEMKKDQAEALRPITEKMMVLEGWLQRDLMARGVESEKSKKGTAFLSTVSSATVKDRDAFLAFVKEKEMWDLLENRAAKSVVQDYLEETNEVVPGVNYQETKVVRIRR